MGVKIALQKSATALGKSGVEAWSRILPRHENNIPDRVTCQIDLMAEMLTTSSKNQHGN